MCLNTESSPVCLKTSIYLQSGLSKLISQWGTGSWLCSPRIPPHLHLQLPVIHNFIFHPNPITSCHLKILLENSKQTHTMKGIPADTASLVRPSKEKSKDFWQTQHTVKATIMLFLPHVPLTYCPQLLLEEGGKPTESELLFNSATVALTIRSPLEPPALPRGINHSRASVEPLTKSSLKDKPRWSVVDTDSGLMLHFRHILGIYNWGQPRPYSAWWSAQDIEGLVNLNIINQRSVRAHRWQKQHWKSTKENHERRPFKNKNPNRWTSRK